MGPNRYLKELQKLSYIGLKQHIDTFNFAGISYLDKWLWISVLIELGRLLKQTSRGAKCKIVEEQGEKVAGKNNSLYNVN